MDWVKTLKEQHTKLRAELDLAESSITPERLDSLRTTVKQHLEAKDSFYKVVAELCSSQNDVVGGTLVRLFESNMQTLTRPVVTFIASGSPAGADQVAKVAKLLRDRIAIEEQAVFSIYVRHAGNGVKKASA